MSEPIFSIGMCSNDQNRAKEALTHWQRGLSDVAPQFPAIIANAKSMAEGYNQIIDQCKTEFLILTHHDAWPLSQPNYQCGQRLLKHLETTDLLGFAGARRVVGPRWFDHMPSTFGSVVNYPAQPAPNPETAAVWAAGMRPAQCTVWNRPARLVRGIRAMDGYCLIGRTIEFKRHKFDTRFTHFHHYDTDISMQFHAAGLRTAVCCDVYISHNSTGSYPQAEWASGVEVFLDKWAGKFDGSITGVGKSATAYQSSDARLILLELQRDEALMKDEI